MRPSASKSASASSRFRRLLLAGSTTLAVMGSAQAAPVQYSFDDSGFGDGLFAGSGLFSLDIGPVLGETYSDFNPVGHGDSFGTWESVTFLAFAGGSPSITISNLVASSLTFSFPGIGGGGVHSGSRADLEWENFLAQANNAGLRITPVTPGVPVVPEASTWLVSIVLGLGVVGTQVWRARR